MMKKSRCIILSLCPLCVHNYFVLTRENKNIQEIINEFRTPKNKKIMFELSQEDWTSMLDKIIIEKNNE
jgi:hypothetical protein